MSSPEEEYGSKVVDLPDARRPVVCFLGGGRNVGRKSYKCGGPYQNRECSKVRQDRQDWQVRQDRQDMQDIQDRRIENT